MTYSRNHSRRLAVPGVFFLLIVLMLLTGCATQTRALLQKPDENLPRHVELASTPFFPQERYQCGPAALAMSLNAAGIVTMPETLESQVYIPQREGSLQMEMLAAGRRNGALSMTIPPTLHALLTEVAAGTPVLVLQNLSLPWFPRWHYALVIGYDLDQEEIILRSGTTKRLTLPLSTFEHTWGRSGGWGMVTLPVGRLPETAEEGAAVDALIAVEQTSDAALARKAYAGALERWPHNIALQLGLGNAAYASGDRVAAVAAFRLAAEEHPDSVPAFNNLATVLAELGDFEPARQAAKKAVSLGGPWHQTAHTTLKAIEAEQKKTKRY